jgi:hypothetical protein
MASVFNRDVGKVESLAELADLAQKLASPPTLGQESALCKLS